MCVLCRSYPCHPRCPNASKPEPIYTCKECGEGIFEDDKYYDAGDGYICESCMDEKTVSEVLELFGESLSVASSY